VDAAHHGAIVSKYDMGVKGWVLAVGKDSRFLFALRSTGDSEYHKVSSLTSYTLGEWYYGVGTKEGSKQYIYVNGKREAEAVNGGGSLANCEKCYIGQYRNKGFRFRGAIDNVAIFDTALSDSEIQKRYQTGCSRIVE